jgi:hypothetical protein
MANRDVTPSEVSSICNELEVSPSKSQPTSPIYHGSHRDPQVSPKTQGGKSAAEGSEKGFKAGRKMATK